MDLLELEHKLHLECNELDCWLEKAFEGASPRPYNGEVSCGYPNWGDIIDVLKLIVGTGRLQRLSKQATDDMLFAFSRSDELALISWISKPEKDPAKRSYLSVGNITEDDFTWLCEQSLLRNEDFSDFQLVVAMRNRESLSHKDVVLLSGFMKRTDSYTRRMVLQTLSYFQHEDILPWIYDLWQDDDEWAKLSCLHSLKPYEAHRVEFEKLLQKYKELYDVQAEEYRKLHIDQLIH